jgi:ribosomal RNA-processing protein 36
MPSARKKKGSAAGSIPHSGSDEEAEDDHPRRNRHEEKDQKKSFEKHKRTSKHAPVELTSKKRVSRRRDFIEVPKVQARDPRFMPLGAGSSVASTHGAASKIEEIKARKAYSFLDEYQQDELNQLRAAAKKEKDPVAKEKLEKAVMSMESRLKAQKRKDRERELLEEHRKKEKELVQQGKQPFYLKRSEQKKKLLLDQFANMKKSQVDKAIERRRKKVAGKEKKLLPWARRTAEDR